MLQLVMVFLMLLTTPVDAKNMSSADSAYAYSFAGIDGKPLPLESYRGKVVLIVNTASQCGFTPQYADLQKLYETYKSRGLVVVGVPSDNFGGQEPASDKEIKTFASEKFHVMFPLTSKTDVVGDKPHPFYVWAAKQVNSGLLGASPRWNFHKFLIGRDGQLLNSFVSSVTPMGTTMTEAVEAALAK